MSFSGVSSFYEIYRRGFTDRHGVRLKSLSAFQSLAALTPLCTSDFLKAFFLSIQSHFFILSLPQTNHWIFFQSPRFSLWEVTRVKNSSCNLETQANRDGGSHKGQVFLHDKSVEENTCASDLIPSNLTYKCTWERNVSCRLERLRCQIWL